MTYHEHVRKRASSKIRPVVALAGVGSILILSAFSWVKFWPKPDTATYQLIYGTPKGWNVQKVHPGSLFLFREPKQGFVLRGSMLSLVSDINPTPEIDTDVFAAQYLSLGDKKMPQWSSEVLDTVDASGIPFRMIRRTGPNHHALIAVCVRGNTTFTIVLSSDEEHRNTLESLDPWFRGYVASLAMKKESPNWAPATTERQP